jgi:putative sterol carrier protein
MTRAAELFERLARVGRIGALRNVRTSYVYHVQNAGDWRVTIDEGAIRIQNDAPDAEGDATFTCDEQEFVDMVEGRRKMTTTAMQGRLGFKGDFEHLVVQAPLFESISPTPPRQKFQAHREYAK